MAIVRDCKQTENHPQIRAFVDAVNAAISDGILSQSQFQDRDFTQYWSNSVITRYIEDKDDFLFVLVGGELVAVAGQDMTGKYVSDINFNAMTQELRDFNLDVIRECRPIYCSGSLDIANQGYKTWRQVKIPFEMNGQRNQTLGYTIFEVEAA